MLKSKVEVVADANHDGTLSPTEWANVYEELGLKYNPKIGGLPQLTVPQMATYLENHHAIDKKTLESLTK